MKNCKLPRVVRRGGMLPVSDVLHMRRMRRLPRADVTAPGMLGMARKHVQTQGTSAHTHTLGHRE